MEPKEKIILITHNQFGYQTDFYKYSLYLKEYYEIVYICLNRSDKMVEMPGVVIHYLKSSKFKPFLLIRFIFSLISIIKKEKPKIVLVKYFPLCFTIILASLKPKYVLDIRSASVTKNSIINTLSDCLLKLAHYFFKFSIVLSQSLKDKFKLSKAKVIPLGADIIDASEKAFDDLRLLYVGTLNNRDIHKTIEGVSLFLSDNPSVKLKYTIVGNGSKDSVQNLSELIDLFHLQDIVFYKGPLNYSELIFPFKESNIGISFIPMTAYFDKQPPTKTFEYLMSGMPVIATNTFENRRIINDQCGVLVDDNAVSFANGLKKINDKRNDFSSLAIGKLYLDSTWENIVNSKLYPLLKTIQNDKTF